MTLPMAPAPPALVFDLDGTLVDSAPDIGVAINKMLREDGRPVLDPATVISFVGDGAAQLVRRAFAVTGPAPQENALDTLLARFMTHYHAAPATLTAPYPDVDKVLSQLKQAGHRLGVCTNKPDALITAVLEGTGLARHFDAAVGPDKVTRRKPDPAHLRATLDAMNVTPGAPAIMVGDSVNDVRAAHGLNLPCICVTYGYTHGRIEDWGADLLIDRFADLPAALGRLTSAVS
ncbi:MAG: phosphoglycolate phosphatase [Alphaproteobacteria bacterium]